MRPTSRNLSVALLVGCLAIPITVPGAQECNGPYKGRKPTPEEIKVILRDHQVGIETKRAFNDPLQVILRDHQVGIETKRAFNDPLRVNLCQANLQKSNLRWANLQEANLVGANFQEADLRWANLERANLVGASLVGANLERAYLVRANFQEADLRWANLERANLVGANLQEADLRWANLQKAVYEPDPEKLPILWTLAYSFNLETLVFLHSPAVLIALREAFKKGGMRTQERQLTYAVEHNRRLKAWNPRGYNLVTKDFQEYLLLLMNWPIVLTETDNRPWLEKLAGKSESLFSYILFALPSQYGMAPRRALWSLFGLIPGFALFYWIALQNANSPSGLWMIVPTDRLTKGRGHERVVRIGQQTAKTWRGYLRGTCRLIRTSLYFSLLSAFHLGWRELNVGTWITRLQPREYTLRATGWVRTVSGIQSLLSVYLLALWVLTYFGRPFE
jgi:Pentapeptide repeats (8 copies)